MPEILEEKPAESLDDLPLRGLRVCAIVSNDTSIDSRVKKECSALVEAGAEVTLIGRGSLELYPGDISQLPYRLILVPKYKPRGKHDLGAETVFYPLRVSVNILRSLFTRYKRFRATRDDRYLRGLFPYIRVLFFEATKGMSFDFIHINDFDMLATGVLIANHTGAKIVYDSHELYLGDGRFPGMDPAELEYLRSIERALLKRVSRVITVNPKIAESLVGAYDVTPAPTVIYNGSTKCAVNTTPVHDPLRVLFLGAFQEFFHFPQLIPQMERFRGKLELTLRGYGGEEAAIQEAIAASHSEDFIRLVPPVDTFLIVDSSKDYDLGLLNIEVNNQSLVLCSPNKLFDYLSAGLGVVASRQQMFVASVIEETNCGFTYDQKKPEDLLSALDYLVARPDRIAVMKRNALATAPRFTWDAQKLKLVELYSSLR